MKNNIDSTQQEINSTELNTEEESKGNQLEKEFAEFMKSTLNWGKVRVGAHLVGKNNTHGAKVDIVAQFDDSMGNVYKKCSRFLIGFALFFMLLTFVDDRFIYTGLFSGILSVVFAYFIRKKGIKLYRKNALVECKNLKGKANINHISKSIREMEDYKKSGDTSYNFEYHYFVSSNGYIDNAIKYALEHGIICYEKKNDVFVKSSFYNN